MRFVGLFICIGIVAGAVFRIDLDLYNDASSAQFVMGGAAGYAFINWKSGQWFSNFGTGAVFFGWLGALIGLIAITGGAIGEMEKSENIGSALSVALIPIFYGYLAKLVCIMIKPTESIE